MAEGVCRRGRPRLDAAAIRIRCLITREAHPALYDALLKTKGRLRPERLRNLAQLGAMVEAGAFQSAPEDPERRPPLPSGGPDSARIGEDFLSFNL